MAASRKLVALTLAVAAAVAACQDITAPLPSGATRFEPPPVYGRWWGLVERCSGATGDFAKWAWYRLPVATMRAQYDNAEAVTDAANHRILMQEGVEGIGSVIRHEMLHALLGPMYSLGNTARQHPPAYFRGRCGGVVGCDQGCEAGGPAPPSPPYDAPALPLSMIDVGIDVIPTRVSRTGPDRALTIVLHATNATGKAGWLQLASTPGVAPPAAVWWGFRIVSSGQPLPITDLTQQDSTGFGGVMPYGRVPFAAGQTRWIVFDWSGRLYPPGDYQVVGFFNTRQISVPLTITP